MQNTAKSTTGNPTGKPTGKTGITSGKPGGIKVVADYVPKAKRANGVKLPPSVPKKKMTAICPKCNQPIPVDELQEHMRIELLDPRWRDQKQRMNERIHNSGSNTVLNQGAQISSALQSFALYRTDIFVGSDIDRKRKLEEERRRLAEKASMVWDGHTASVAAVRAKVVEKGVDIETQIQEIHKAKGLVGDAAKEAIGPRIVPEELTGNSNKRPLPTDLYTDPATLAKRARSMKPPTLKPAHEWLQTHYPFINITLNLTPAAQALATRASTENVSIPNVDLRSTVRMFRKRVTEDIGLEEDVKLSVEYGGNWFVLTNELDETLADWNLWEGAVVMLGFGH